MRYRKYPPEYLEMFRRAQTETVSLDFSTKEKAVAFRSEMYKYRYAVRDALPESQELYDIVMNVTMSIAIKTLIIKPIKNHFVEKLNER